MRKVDIHIARIDGGVGVVCTTSSNCRYRWRLLPLSLSTGRWFVIGVGRVTKLNSKRITVDEFMLRGMFIGKWSFSGRIAGIVSAA